MYKILLTICSVLLLITSCKKSSGDLPQPATPTAHVKRPFGQPLPGLPAIIKPIGAEGGTISSANHVITVQIPEGAVNTPTVFSIQPVTNTLEGSNGLSFKLLPENVAFEKPVTITYNYQNADLRGTNAAFVKLVYQNSDGYYFIPEGMTNDTAHHTLTVQTKHFSTWSTLEEYKLEGDRSVMLGASVDLMLMFYQRIPPLAPPYDVEVGVWVTDPDYDAALRTAEWSLAGAGALTNSVNEAVYQAPNFIPAMNPVTVSVAIYGWFDTGNPNHHQKMILLQPIAIEAEEYFNVTINQVRYSVSQPVFFMAGNQLHIAAMLNGTDQLNISLNATIPGIFNFKQANEFGAVTMSLIPGANPAANFISFRNACNIGEPTVTYSGSNFVLDKVPEQAGEFIKGSIAAATLYTGGNYCAAPEQKTISVSFNMIRH